MTNEEAHKIENGFVDFADRKERTNAFRGIMNMLGFGINYQMADLILEAIAIMDGDEEYSNVRDITHLQAEWHKKYEHYFKEQQASSEQE